MTLLADLRAAYQADGFAGFLIPRADKHQNETPPACDERLAFATGFTGSAGLAIILDDRAALFVDGRYETQAAQQIDTDAIEVVMVPRRKTEDWLSEAAAPSMKLAYDPWLHTASELEKLDAAAKKAGAELAPAPRNYLDALWPDRPAAPTAAATAHPIEYAGETAHEKRARIAELLKSERIDAALLTDPTIIAWLLNIRGSDTPNTPIVLAYALLASTGDVRLFSDPTKFDRDLRETLGEKVSIENWDAFSPALEALTGRIGVDKGGAPAAAADALGRGKAEIVWREDPCALPRARKNETELAGARAAHRIDGAALCRFFAWLERQLADGAPLDEAAISAKLTQCRAETATALGSSLIEESFESIIAYGPNAALPHYRPPETGSAAVSPRHERQNTLLLIDSGGQYPAGTTDITRTIAIGAPSLEMRADCTRVLQGMIAISELVFPEKTEGRSLDSVARLALWRSGRDYDHGTGHGVGSFLSVHEGPQRLSPRAAAPLEPGMILSNEPGRYKPGDFGVRLENLIIVAPATPPTDALLPGEPVGERPMHQFETLTLCPFDRRILTTALLSPAERAWLDQYHAWVRRELEPMLTSGPAADPAAAAWLGRETQPLSG